MGWSHVLRARRRTARWCRSRASRAFGDPPTPLSISHQGQFPATTISFNLAPGVALGEAVKAIHGAETADRHARDASTPAFRAPRRRSRRRSTSEPWLILAALFAVYIVLGMLYESLIHPITILSTLPSAALGALLALLLLQRRVQHHRAHRHHAAARHREEERDHDDRLRARGRTRRGAGPARRRSTAPRMLRFRPILMTTLAALLGALPLALGLGAGSELRRPLGITIVGGPLRLADAHAVHDAGHLPLSRPVATSARPRAGVRARVEGRADASTKAGSIPERAVRRRRPGGRTHSGCGRSSTDRRARPSLGRGASPPSRPAKSIHPSRSCHRSTQAVRPERWALPAATSFGDCVNGDGVVKDGTVSGRRRNGDRIRGRPLARRQRRRRRAPEGAVVLAPDVPVGARYGWRSDRGAGGRGPSMSAAPRTCSPPRTCSEPSATAVAGDALPAAPTGGFGLASTASPRPAPERRGRRPALRQTTATNTRAICPTRSIWILRPHRETSSTQKPRSPQGVELQVLAVGSAHAPVPARRFGISARSARRQKRAVLAVPARRLEQQVE